MQKIKVFEVASSSSSSSSSSESNVDHSIIIKKLPDFKISIQWKPHTGDSAEHTGHLFHT
jgi:hypothetical protein